MVLFISSLTGLASAGEFRLYPDINMEKPTAPSSIIAEDGDLEKAVRESLKDFSGSRTATVEKNAGQRATQGKSKSASAADRVAIPWGKVPWWCYVFRPCSVTAQCNTRTRDETLSISAMNLTFSDRTCEVYRWGHMACVQANNLSKKYRLKERLNKFTLPILGSFVASGTACAVASQVPILGSSLIAPLLQPFFTTSAAATAVWISANYLIPQSLATSGTLAKLWDCKFPSSIEADKVVNTSRLSNVLSAVFRWRSAQVAYQN